MPFFDVEKADNYDNNYQYDGGIPFAFSKSFLRGANVFEAKADEKMQLYLLFPYHDYYTS